MLHCCSIAGSFGSCDCLEPYNNNNNNNAKKDADSCLDDAARRLIARRRDGIGAVCAENSRREELDAFTDRRHGGRGKRRWR